MLNETIHIDNYEAYYLDYLEGNLSSEQVVLFEQFLEQHPELVEEDMEQLEPIHISLDPSFKEELKVFDASATITTHNIESFLVAEKEGVLTLSELGQLKDFLSRHPAYAADRRQYAATTLTADSNLVYGDKSGLYRKKGLVLWPYWSGLAAAASIALLFWFLPSGEQDLQWQAPPLAKLNTEKSSESIVQASDAQPSIQIADNSVALPSTQPSRQAIKPRRRKNKAIDGQIIHQPFEAFQTAETGKTIDRQFNNTTFYSETSSNAVDDVPEDFALSMNNPVEPITRKLSDLIKQPVEYAKGTNEQASRKGFYLKIGKLEIYNNRGN